MSKNNVWYEYKVEATVEYDAGKLSVTDTALYDMHSAWISDREQAVNLAESLREVGHGVEIRTRKRGSYGANEFEDIPERDSA